MKTIFIIYNINYNKYFNIYHLFLKYVWKSFQKGIFNFYFLYCYVKTINIINKCFRYNKIKTLFKKKKTIIIINKLYIIFHHQKLI